MDLMNLTPSQHTDMALRYVRKRTSEAIVFFSGGKDSWVLLDIATRYFTKVHAVYMYLVEGLDHVEQMLDQVRKYPNVEVLQYAHWASYEYLRKGYYRFPSLNINKDVSLDDIITLARQDTGVEWVFRGIRRAESQQRFMWLGTLAFISISESKKTCYPLSKWRLADVKKYLKWKNIRPLTYNVASQSTALDIGLEQLLWLRNNYPGDLQKLLDVFPFAGQILFEYDYKQNTEQ